MAGLAAASGAAERPGGGGSNGSAAGAGGAAGAAGAATGGVGSAAVMGAQQVAKGANASSNAVTGDDPTSDASPGPTGSSGISN